MVNLRNLFVLSGLLLTCACQRGTPLASAKLSVRFPAKLSPTSIGSVDSTLFCYAVNVKGDGIPSTSASCDVQRGVFAGSALPGAEITVAVPAGANRTVEVYGLLRNSSSESCPNAAGGVWGMPLNRVYFLGSEAGIQVSAPSTDVAITVSTPALSQNILAQNRMAASCGTPLLNPRGGQVYGSSAQGVTSPSGYLVQSRVSFKREHAPTTSSNGYQIMNSSTVTGVYQ